MRKLLSLLPIFLLFWVFAGCRDNSAVYENAPSTISYNIDIASAKEIPFEEAFAELQVIPLEENSSAYLKGANKILVHEEDIFVLDRPGGKVIVFEKDGKHKHTISTILEGPVKIGAIYDFDVNPFTGMVDLLSPDGKIVTYDLKEKTYTTKIDVRDSDQAQSYHAFINISPEVVVFYSSFDDHFFHGYSLKIKDFIWESIENVGFKYFFAFSSPPRHYVHNKEVRLYDYVGGNLITINAEGARIVDRPDFGVNQFILEEANPGAHPEGGAFVWQYLEGEDLFYPISNFFVKNETLFVSGTYNIKRWMYWQKEGKPYVAEVPKVGATRLTNAYEENYFHGVVLSPDKEVTGMPLKLRVVLDSLNEQNKGQEMNPVFFRFKLKEE